MSKRGGYRRHSKVIWPGYSEVETRHVTKVGRNEPCPCGGGKKYKDCHESEGDAFLKRLAVEKDREVARELRRQAKERGVPWYKRIFIRA